MRLILGGLFGGVNKWSVIRRVISQILLYNYVEHVNLVTYRLTNVGYLSPFLCLFTQSIERNFLATLCVFVFSIDFVK